MNKFFEEYKMRIPDTGIEEPSGYRVLVYPLKPREATAGGIIKIQDTLDREADVVMGAYVVAMGPDAYKGKRFEDASKPWCQVGDWVMVSRHAGIRVTSEGEQLRVINDDEVICKLSDPTKITKK